MRGGKDKAAVVDRFEVGEDYQLPERQDLAPDGEQWRTGEDHLETVYVDTPSARLAQFGITLRRRSGGPDPGWLLSVPAGGPPVEISDGAGSSTPPAALTDLMSGVRAGEELAPVAQVSVHRTTHRLLDGAGSVLVQLTDDLVSGATTGSQSRISSWREIAVEPGPGADPRLSQRVAKRVMSVGARRAGPGSPLQRTLGLPAHDRTAPDVDTVGGLAWVYLAAQGREIVRCDIGLRHGEPLVHPFRVAIRRLRSTLRVFERLFDPAAAAALEAELVWFAGLLGEVRDREVLRARLAAQLAELPAEYVLGPVAAHIETTLLLERAHHQERVTEAMGGERYRDFLQLVLRWSTRPPLTRSAGKPVADASRYLGRAARKVDRRLSGADGDVEALHGARKAAKRYRYAAELTAQAGGKKATRIVRSTTTLQTLLGEHQDSVVSAAFLRRLGAEAGAGGQNGFTYGFLVAEELQRARSIRDEAAHRWGHST